LAGLPLVVQDSAASADAIVVLVGDHVLERIHRAAQLYRDGYAPRVVISGGAIVRDGDEPMSEAQMMRRYIVRLGVPEEALLLEQTSQTTVQNALFTQPILQHNNIHSILLVTSPYHSRRARRIFRDALGEGITITAQPAVDPSFCALCWLAESDQRPMVVSEYCKWMIYWFARR